MLTFARFLIAISKALAWPVAAVVIVWLLRDWLGALISATAERLRADGGPTKPRLPSEAPSDRSFDGASVLTLNTRGLLRIGWWTVAIAIALGILAQILISVLDPSSPLRGYIRVIAFDDEMTFQSWLSSLLMAVASLLLFAEGALARPENPWMARRWFVLGIIFIYMSLDETVSIHELGFNLNQLHQFTGAFYFGWVVIAIPLVLIGGLFFISFLAALPRPIAVRMIVSGTVYVSGALGMELVGGYLWSTREGVSNPYLVASAIEETLEMVGLMLFVSVLLDVVAERTVAIRWRHGAR